MDNPEKQETQVTQDEEKQSKNKDTTQHNIRKHIVYFLVYLTTFLFQLENKCTGTS